jgi:pyruvate formate lyase activating enzyme
VDAANVDLKAFTEGLYGRVTLTHLQPVLDMLVWLKEETNVWFEITNLVIPTLNDDPREFRQLSDWILEHLGAHVPLHFTAFHPDFKLQDKPRTPPETLHAARNIARDAGLHYVYEGNIFSDAAHTFCPDCGTAVIRRSWHNVLQNSLVFREPVSCEPFGCLPAGARFQREAACPNCGVVIPGRWTNDAVPSKPAIARAADTVARKYGALNL